MTSALKPDGDIVTLARHEYEMVVIAKGVLAAGQAAIPVHALVAGIEKTANADAAGKE